MQKTHTLLERTTPSASALEFSRHWLLFSVFSSFSLEFSKDSETPPNLEKLRTPPTSSAGGLPIGASPPQPPPGKNYLPLLPLPIKKSIIDGNTWLTPLPFRAGKPT